MQIPKHQLVAEIVSQLDPVLREEFEERAAIMEFDAAMLRDHAECLALLDVLYRHPETLLNVEHGDAPEVSKMKKYFGKLYERNGDFEYSHPVLFEADADPVLELTRMAREFYPGTADERDDGFYFFCGGIYIKPESVVEVTGEEYAVLMRFI